MLAYAFYIFYFIACFKYCYAFTSLPPESLCSLVVCLIGPTSVPKFVVGGLALFTVILLISGKSCCSDDTVAKIKGTTRVRFFSHTRPTCFAWSKDGDKPLKVLQHTIKRPTVSILNVPQPFLENLFFLNKS